MVKNYLPVQEMQVPSLSLEDPLEKEIATHSSILTWEILWTEEPGRLQSIGWQRVRHVLATKQQQHTAYHMPELLLVSPFYKEGKEDTER